RALANARATAPDVAFHRRGRRPRAKRCPRRTLWHRCACLLAGAARRGRVRRQAASGALGRRAPERTLDAFAAQGRNGADARRLRLGSPALLAACHAGQIARHAAGSCHGLSDRSRALLEPDVSHRCLYSLFELAHEQWKHLSRRTCLQAEGGQMKKLSPNERAAALKKLRKWKSVAGRDAITRK